MPLPIIVEEIVSEENANIQSMFVRDRAVLIVPLSYFNLLIDDNAYVEMRIQTAQHKEAMECLADRGFPQTVDIAAATNNSRQVYTIAKLVICLFSILMTVIISLNVCNTISNTIHLRRSEFCCSAFWLYDMPKVKMYAIARSCFVRRKSIGSCVACELFDSLCYLLLHIVGYDTICFLYERRYLCSCSYGCRRYGMYRYAVCC